ATRELARRLNVSRTTVTVAYDRLTGEGFITSRVGAGTFVGDGGAGPGGAARRRPRPRRRFHPLAGRARALRRRRRRRSGRHGPARPAGAAATAALGPCPLSRRGWTTAAARLSHPSPRTH